MSTTGDVLHSTVPKRHVAERRTPSSRSWITAGEVPDTDLIEGIATGDTAAMHALYTRHDERVYRFALRIAGNEAVAEDVVSETFIDVWRKAGTFEGRSQVSTWLLAIARHKAIEILRRRPAEAWDNEAFELIADAADDQEIALQRKQQGSILFKCLSSLSPAHREIIDLVYYHQKSIDDVAKIIQAPRSTVKTRMFYARQRLAVLLDAQGVTTAMA